MVKKEITKKVSVKEYATTLADLKKRIQEAQVKSLLAANKELIKLYWSIGETIVEKQKIDGWGSKTIEQLAKDLQNEFPGLAGFSRANMFKMRSFYTTYAKVSQAVRQFDKFPIFNIPWGHNIILITKLKNNEERMWYAQQAIENGWSRSMLEMWIESNLHKRQGKGVTNFAKTLPEPDSDMAQKSFKDPYLFDFLTLHEGHLEKDIEQGLIDHIQKFLLELGEGFSFVGRQYHLEIGDQDFYIDLLFYHLKLRRFVVIELKNTAFKPEYAGQLNFYLSAVDDLLRHPNDNQTIGLLLCKTKNNIVVEYALKDLSKPINVSEYETKIKASLPKELKGSLPTVKEIEEELEKQEILQRGDKKIKISKTETKKSKKKTKLSSKN